MSPSPLLALRAIAVEKWTLAFLGLLAKHAVDAGAGGDLVVQAQLISRNIDPVGWRPLAITEIRDQPVPEAVLGSQQLVAPSPTETTVSISVVTDPADLITAAAGVAGDLLAEFAVPVPRVLLPDGQFDPTADQGGDVDVLTSWAERPG